MPYKNSEDRRTNDIKTKDHVNARRRALRIIKTVGQDLPIERQHQ